MNIAVILPAAGAGRRFAGNAAQSKIEIELNGRAVFLRAAQLFLKRPEVCQVILAVRPDDLDAFTTRWAAQLAFHDIKLVAGGKLERWQTVQKALEIVDPQATHVAVHDAARPLTSKRLIDRVFEAAETYAAVIPALPASSTLKRVEDLPKDQVKQDPLDAILGSAGKNVGRVRRVVETIDRRDVVEVQTPQVFEIGLFRSAYAKLADGSIASDAITDDAALIEATGQTVYVVDGEPTNLKITHPEDATLAQALVRITEKTDAKATAKQRLFGDDE